LTENIPEPAHSEVVESVRITTEGRSTGAGLNPGSLEARTGIAEHLDPRWNDTGRNTRPTPVGASDLIGRWRIDQGQNILGFIEFRSNGTYHYIVGETKEWKVEHEG